MLEIKYKKILFVQATFLIIQGLITLLFYISNSAPALFIIFWIIATILNLLYIKHSALPTKSLLRKINKGKVEGDLSWLDIEESITRKELINTKQKEESKLENLQYKRLLNSLADPVCIFTNDLVIIYANHAFRSLFDLIGKKLPFSLIEVTRNLEFQKILMISVKSQKASSKNYFTFNQLHDLHKLFYDLKIFPLDGLNNYLCLFHDVTERKMIDQIREDFVSNFSHEVRTPLTILNGQMQTLKAVLEKEVDYENRFSQTFIKIDNNSKRLINLFNDLLQLTSIESSKEINKEVIEIEEMVTFLIQDLLNNYPHKRIQIDIHLEQNIFFVDYHLFEQILLNLIDNSLKYIIKDGIISVRSYRQNDWDYLIIKDNGVGIPEDQIHRIFERFFRIDSSRSSEIEGSGLGLSIVKHIIQKHNGKIKADCSPENGTIFTLSFPAH